MQLCYIFEKKIKEESNIFNNKQHMSQRSQTRDVTAPGKGQIYPRPEFIGFT
jgi:hypothetical protein